MPVLQDHLHSVQALSNLAWYASRLRRVEIKADRHTFKLEKEIEELIKKAALFRNMKQKNFGRLRYSRDARKDCHHRRPSRKSSA